MEMVKRAKRKGFCYAPLNWMLNTITSLGACLHDITEVIEDRKLGGHVI